jgi:hypothetical protein
VGVGRMAAVQVAHGGISLSQTSMSDLLNQTSLSDVEKRSPGPSGAQNPGRRGR